MTILKKQQPTSNQISGFTSAITKLKGNQSTENKPVLETTTRYYKMDCNGYNIMTKFSSLAVLTNFLFLYVIGKQ